MLRDTFYTNLSTSLQVGNYSLWKNHFGKLQYHSSRKTCIRRSVRGIFVVYVRIPNTSHTAERHNSHCVMGWRLPLPPDAMILPKKNRTLFVRAQYGTYTYPFYNIRNTTCNSLSGKVNTQPQETTFTKKARVFGVYTYCKCNPCITSCLNVDCTYTRRILFRCLFVV